MAFGRLEPQSGAQPMSDINMTPLIDVMLVLLVIFIITAPLLGSALRLDLPTAAGTRSLAAPQSVQVAISAQGQYFWSDRPVSGPELAALLRTAASARADTEVQLRADRAVAYARVLDVIGMAQQAGLTRIGFVAQPQAQAAARVRP